MASLTIIIPTLNEENVLPRLLESLKSQSYRDFEVVVSDANSSDKTRKIALDSGAKVVTGGNISTGRNNGAKEAKSELICFMDADIHFESNFLEESLLQMKEGSYEVCVPIFDTKGQELKSKFLYWVSDTTKKIKLNSKNKFATCQCMFITQKAFEKTGGFDEALSIGEDVEFMQKVSKLNLNFGLLNTKIIASERRFKQAGVLRVLIASLFFTILIPIGLSRLKGVQEKITQLYGDWGNY